MPAAVFFVKKSAAMSRRRIVFRAMISKLTVPLELSRRFSANSVLNA
jgi:hypothetical protein